MIRNTPLVPFSSAFSAGSFETGIAGGTTGATTAGTDGGGSVGTTGGGSTAAPSFGIGGGPTGGTLGGANVGGGTAPTAGPVRNFDSDAGLNRGTSGRSTNCGTGCCGCGVTDTAAAGSGWRAASP